MKKTFITAIVMMATLVACESSSTKLELVTINVESDYPEKELIIRLKTR